MTDRRDLWEALRDLADAAQAVVESQYWPINDTVIVRRQALRNLAAALAIVKPNADRGLAMRTADVAGSAGGPATIASAQAADAGTYAVGVSNAAGATSSNDAVLTVNPANSVTPPAGWELLPNGDIRQVECSPTDPATCWAVVGESINAVTRGQR